MAKPKKTEPAVEQPANEKVVERIIEKVVEVRGCSSKTDMVIIATSIIFSGKQNTNPGVSVGKQMDASLSEAVNLVNRVFAMKLDETPPAA